VEGTLSTDAPDKPASEAILEIRLLGQPVVHLNGQPARVAIKTIGLLAYLALEGRTLRRTIALKLWPDSADPLNNLSVARHALTKVLGVDALEYDTDSVWIDVPYQCDAIAWRKTLGANPREAWDAWTGTFLEGYQLSDWDRGLGEEFEEWVLQNREAFGDDRRELAAHLGTESLRQGDLPGALPYLETAHQTNGEPREDAGRWLILCLGALGFTDRATATYVQLARALREELEVEPTRATREALETVRSGTPADCRAALEQEFVPAQAAPKPALETEVPLVGRDTELERLRAEFEIARTGRARLTVIQGEPGAGKTRLARALIEQAGRDALTAIGVAAPTGLPLVAFDRLARALVRERADAVRALGVAQREALARFLPDVRAHGLTEPVGSPASPEYERRALFEAIRALLTHPDKPALVLLDDIQWADQATLELALHLLTNPPPRGILIVATQRDTESPSADPRPLLERQSRENLGPRIVLEPLPEDACASVAQYLGRTDADPARLRRSTGGNPFYLIELLRAEPGTAARRVQDLLRTRLETLPEIAYQTLETIAVLGDNANANITRRVAGRSLEEISDAFETLRRAGLVRLEDTVAFNHDLTREVVLSDLSHTRLELLSLRAARIRRDTPTLAAEHYWTAKEVWDDEDAEPAIKAFVETGSSTAMRGDLEDGLQWFERGLEVAPTDTLRVRTLTNKARVLERYLRYEEALGTLEQAERLAENVDVVTRAGVWNARGTLMAYAMGEAETVRDLGQRALNALSSLSTSEAQIERGNALNNLGVAESLSGNFGEAEVLHRKSLEIQRDFGQKSHIISSMLNLGADLRNLDTNESEIILKQALLISEETGNQSALSRIYNTLGYLYTGKNEYQEAINYFEESIRINLLLGEDHIWSEPYNNLGAIYFYKKEYEAAISMYKKALSAKTVRLNNHLKSMYLANIAEAELHLGEIDHAERDLKSATLLLADAPKSNWWSDVHYFEAEIWVIRTNIEAAKISYRLSIDIARATDNFIRLSLALGRLARLEFNDSLAREAIIRLDSAISQASLQVALRQYSQARKTIRSANSDYEEGRLLVDIARHTNDKKMLEKGFQLLRLPFRAG
jgi:tetratricopeptide (TPR) repeat protein